MSRAVTWNHYRFISSFQREGLDPWDSEPPGGMFPPGPAQLPCQNPSLSHVLLLWINLKTYKAAEPDLWISIWGVTPNLQALWFPGFCAIPWVTIHDLLPTFQRPSSSTTAPPCSQMQLPGKTRETLKQSRSVWILGNLAPAPLPGALCSITCSQFTSKAITSQCPTCVNIQLGGEGLQHYEGQGTTP